MHIFRLLAVLLTVIFSIFVPTLTLSTPAFAGCIAKQYSVSLDSPWRQPEPVDRWGDSLIYASSLSPTSGGEEIITYYAADKNEPGIPEGNPCTPA